MRQKIWSLTQSLRLYSICVLCNQFHHSKMAICTPCIEFMTRLGPACRYCAYPLPDTYLLVCGRCIKKTPYFDRTLINYVFEEPLRNLLHQFKYHNGLYLGSFLSELMSHSLPKNENMPQCLIPVPMHPQRIKLRGFNQAAVLVRLLAKKLQLPYDLTSCQKILNTEPQASLDGEQRQKNLRHAFKVKKIPWHHVAIVDDLLTTGSTANELARALKKSGVKKVDVWCCARAVSKL
ncbi:ComF family protein [Legionella bozemanae]|uniref:ComF family protein n=1 Tax=Legionella bozemanae TaxID=447 RepID=UPI003F6E6A35